MFDQMAAVLPTYGDFLKHLTTGARVMNEALSTRALSIMSFVYSDLIHLCFDACKISQKGNQVGQLGGGCRQIRITPSE
jgi:hypothetical protein